MSNKLAKAAIISFAVVGVVAVAVTVMLFSISYSPDWVEYS